MHAPADPDAVLNQSTTLARHNLYETDRALRAALTFHAPHADEACRSALGAHGTLPGSVDVDSIVKRAMPQ